MAMARGAINFSYQVASFGSRTASKTLPRYSMPRRVMATQAKTSDFTGESRDPFCLNNPNMSDPSAPTVAAMGRSAVTPFATRHSEEMEDTELIEAFMDGGEGPAPTLDELSMDLEDELSTPGPRVDVVDHPVTIGQALEVAGGNIGDKPITQTDAKVIQSAESRATGNAPGVKRVVAAEAQSAADVNAVGSTDALPTVKDVLENAAAKMPIDKVVTREDAARVQSVEHRNTGKLEPRGISATIQSAADKNAASDFEPRSGTEGRIPKI